jgi:flagellar biosynthetic protein FliR
MIYELTLQEIWPYLLVGGRLLGLMSFLPGLSQGNIPYPVKIFLTAALTSALTPVIFLASPPSSVTLLWLGKEVAIGILWGLALKGVFSTLDLVGSITSFQMSLANVFVSNPESQQQSGLNSTFLTLMATTLLFVNHLHFVIIEAFIKSFSQTYTMDHWHDYFALFLDIITTSFTLSITLAGPLIIVSVLIYAMAGILNRLVPQVQVFFLVQPLQLFLGFLILMLTLPLILDLFMERFTDFLSNWGEAL